MTLKVGKQLTTREIVERLQIRDGNFCQYPECGKDFTADNPPTIDHFWLPVSKGGGWELENLKLMCKRCNAIKGDRLPDANGNLPPLKRELKQKAPSKTERPSVCDTCMSGRILLPGEYCPDCGSGAQPAVAPRAMQVAPKDCDHSTSHCWLCYLGFVERKAAILTVVDAENLD